MEDMDGNILLKEGDKGTLEEEMDRGMLKSSIINADGAMVLDTGPGTAHKDQDKEDCHQMQGHTNLLSIVHLQET